MIFEPECITTDYFTKDKMIKLYKKKIKIAAIVGLLTLTGTVFADDPCNNGNGVVCLTNPLRFETINEFLEALSNLLITLGVALVTLMVLVGALLIMFGGQDPKYFEKGKNTIKWTALGLFIILFARGVIAAVRYVAGA